MENKFVCPHCQEEYVNIFDFIEPDDNEGSFDEVCDNCGKEFTVHYNTVIYFKTNK